MLNYDAPRSLETYLHRVGRTARAGAGGVAVTLVGDDDRLLVKEVVRKGKVDLQQRMVPAQVRRVVTGLPSCGVGQASTKLRCAVLASHAHGHAGCWRTLLAITMAPLPLLRRPAAALRVLARHAGRVSLASTRGGC